MRQIIIYIRRYFSGVNKKLLTCTTLLTVLLVFVNYAGGLDAYIRNNHTILFKLFAWTLVFGVAFGLPYALAKFFLKERISFSPIFLLLLCAAPLLFAAKMCIPISVAFAAHEGWNAFWNQVVYWPVLMAGTTGILYILWKLTGSTRSFYGLTAKNVNWMPYLIMLACMVPLIAFASTQPDFLATYPKINHAISTYPYPEINAGHKLLFEMAYGTDFFTIELFFRGFLVLGFLKWAGKDAILPMACFYCTIHFGKPLGECISSYFGGILLGIVAMETRSILGGLAVHVGIAWLMELGGYIGNSQELGIWN